MRERLSDGAAAALTVTGLTARLFYGLMIDSPEVHNGAWLSALLGAALALPLLRALSRCPGRMPSALLAALLALDAARTVDCAAASAGYAAFAHVAAGLLALPLLAVAARALYLGDPAMGNAALLLLRPLAALVGLVALVQLPRCQPGWLAPVFGFGLPGIVTAGVRAAGWTALIAGSVARLTGRPFAQTARDVAIAAGLAAALILLRLMMAPAADAGSMSRLNQLDALLTNGRSPLALQLPMIVAWFLGLVNLLCLECWAARGLLARAFGGERWPAAAVLLVTGAAALAQAFRRAPLRTLAEGQLWLLAAAALLYGLLAKSRKGERLSCAFSD